MAIQKTLYLGTDDQGFSAAHDRFSLFNIQSEGVLPTNGGDPRIAVEVVQRALGVNFSVDVKSGWVFIDGDDSSNQGSYAVYNDASVNVPHTMGAPASLPRIDRLVVQVNDSEHTARTPTDVAQIKWEYGSETSGATLANLLGAAPEPNTAFTLAYVQLLVGNTNIVDARIGDDRVISGPVVYGEGGQKYRMGVNSSGVLGLEVV